MELDKAKDLVCNGTIEESNKLRKIMAGAALGLSLATAGVPKAHAQDATKIERSTEGGLNSYSELNLTVTDFKNNFKYNGEINVEGKVLYKWSSKDGKRQCITNFHTNAVGDIVVEKSADAKYFLSNSNSIRNKGGESTVLTLRLDTARVGNHIAAVDTNGNSVKEFYACGVIKEVK